MPRSRAKKSPTKSKTKQTKEQRQKNRKDALTTTGNNRNITEDFKAELRKGISSAQLTEDNNSISILPCFFPACHPFFCHRSLQPPSPLPHTSSAWRGRWWLREDFPLFQVSPSHSPFLTQIPLGAALGLANQFSSSSTSFGCLPPAQVVKGFIPNKCCSLPAWNPD